MKNLENKYLKYGGVEFLFVALLFFIAKAFILAFQAPDNIFVPVLFISTIFVFIILLLIYKIHQGKVWARVFFFCYFIVMLLLNHQNIFIWFDINTTVFYLYVVESFLNLLGLMFIFKNSK